MKVKICGITNLQDAFDAVEAGADALGFVFYEKSPRYILPQDAKKIVDNLPPFVQTVGLFVNEHSRYINNICKLSKMQVAQIIDDENNTEFDKLYVKYIKVVRVKSKKNLYKLNKDNYYLLDAFVEEFGGVGKQIPLKWFENIDCSKFILAGGLTSSMLKDLKGYNFFGVDVSSSVEVLKGKKDKEKMKKFVKVANEFKNK